MSDRPSNNLEGLDLDLARLIEVICRRFEDDRRAGRAAAIGAYLGEVPREGQRALRAELEALEHELRQADDTMPPPEPGPIAEAPTVALASPPTAPIPGLANASVHEEATGPPRDPATVDLGSSQPVPPDASEPARVRYFGDYEITRELARGGMGVVFQARQVSLNRVVALKMILAGQLANETDVKRFYTEAEAAANLDHPGIVPIFEVGQYEGQHYFSMGFVEGQSLSQRLAEGPLPAREAADLIRRVSQAIEYAHQRGVIHRDLKPANVLLDKNGNPRVTDFGLAKKLEGDSGLTGSGQIMGTPSYMPPEQAGGKRGDVGPAADVYALGATLYCLVTGRPPFQAATAMDTVIQVIGEEPVPPRRLNPSVPRDLETIVLKCLEKEPGKRYSSAAGLDGDLRRFLDGEPILARPVGPVERTWRWCRRNPVVADLAGGIALALVLGTVVATYFAVRADKEAGRANQAAGKAIDESRRADQEAQRARDQEQLSDRRRYIAEMNLAQRAWQDSDMDLLRQRLEAQQPKRPDDHDWRGFEWYYLDRLRELDLRTLRGHLSSVAYSPDGRTLASSSHDGAVKIWDAATGREVRTLRGHMGTVTGVAYSRDGRALASAGWDQTVKLWDAATGQEIRTLKGSDSVVVSSFLSVAFSPDGRTVASASTDHTVKLWNVATGQESRTLSHPHGVMVVVYSPDGRTLASASNDGTVKLWNAVTGQEVRSIDGTLLGFSPDGRLATSSDNTVKLWNVATGQEVRTLRGPTDPVRSAVYSPDGHTLATASSDKPLVKLWDADTGKELRTLRGHAIEVSSVAYSPDGRTLASAGWDGVKVWDANASQDAMTLRGHASPVTGVAYSPDGHQIASASWDNTVKIWDAATGRAVRTLRGHELIVAGVAYSPDGRALASASYDKTVKLWDTALGWEVRTLRGHSKGVMGVAYSPDGRQIASASADGTVKLWDAATGREVLTLYLELAPTNPTDGPVLPGTILAYSPDSRRLAAAVGAATSQKDETVKIWDTVTGQEIRTLRGHANVVTAAVYNPDGRTLASASADGTVRLWDAATGQEIRTLRGHANQVSCVAYSPDGRSLTSASNDGTMKLWDAATGQELLSQSGHSFSVSGVAYSPDGRQIASASYDKTVKLWDARPLTPELRAFREARGIVEYLFAQKLAVAEVLARIGRDPTISDAVRHGALNLAESYRQDLQNEEADRLVESLFDTLLLREDILERLRVDANVKEPVRRQALALANHRAEHAFGLRAAALGLVRRPDNGAAAFQRALRLAEAACQTVPEDGLHQSALGVAQYRAGRYHDAVTTLTRSNQLNSTSPGGSFPADLAFLALAQHRLGQTAKARTALGRLRETMKNLRWARNQDAQAFLREANAIELDLVFPANPFAVGP
jgi:WD40 repeat protein